MASKSNPPFRAEHLGSLLRPQELLEQRNHIGDKTAADSNLQNSENEAIKAIVKTQLDLGFRGITDGEYRRLMFWGTFFPSLEGMESVSNPSISMFRPYLPDVAAFLETHHVPDETVVCTGKIRHTGISTYVGQFEYLKSLVTPKQWGDIKLTLAAPEWYHLRYKEGQAYPKDVYPDDAAYFADIATAYQKELDILYAAGLRNVQIDDPNFTYFCSEKMLKGWAEDKDNKQTPEELLDTYIHLYNSCLAHVPPDMHIGIHTCRGNFLHSRHFSEGGYDRVSVKLFHELNVDTFYLEYDTPRAGGFEPLMEIPKHKNVILGVVTSKFPELEDKEEMKKRVYSAADMIGKRQGQTKEGALQRMGVSPQCGFASHAGGNLLSHEDMVEKLKLVRTIADEIWPGEA